METDRPLPNLPELSFLPKIWRVIAALALVGIGTTVIIEAVVQQKARVMEVAAADNFDKSGALQNGKNTVVWRVFRDGGGCHISFQMRGELKFKVTNDRHRPKVCDMPHLLVMLADFTQLGSRLGMSEEELEPLTWSLLRAVKLALGLSG